MPNPSQYPCLATINTPVFGVSAFSGTGKTTLLVSLLPLLRAHALRVGLLKHAHHRFDLDQPGKDSYRLRAAGADAVMIASRQRWALLRETADQPEPQLRELLPLLDNAGLDLILIEGFKHEYYPKLELHRPSLGHPLLCLSDSSVLAIASDAPLPVTVDLPQLDLNNHAAIAAFVVAYLARLQDTP